MAGRTIVYSIIFATMLSADRPSRKTLLVFCNLLLVHINLCQFRLGHCALNARMNMGVTLHFISDNVLLLKINTYKTIILPVVLYGCETWSFILREEHRLRVFENKVLR